MIIPEQQARVKSLLRVAAPARLWTAFRQSLQQLGFLNGAFWSNGKRECECQVIESIGRRVGI